MAKSKNSKPSNPERAAFLQKVGINAGIALLVLSMGGVALHCLKQYVEKKIVYPTRPPTIVLKNRPIWMTDFLAQQIAESIRPTGITSTFDTEMLADRVKMLKGNPWIRTVRSVRREYGQTPGDTLEIDCDFRAPVALVRWGDDFWYVDAQGVKLPEKFTAAQLPRLMFGQDKHTHIRVIEGIKRPPPVAGKVWGGEDLRGGLGLACLLYGRPFTDEILKVRVENFGGRQDNRESQMVLVTKYNTEVRWGRSLDATDKFIEVSPERKMDYLSRVFQEFGRVDARQPWIDIRFDKITYPSPEPTAVQASSN
jgi:hypothetical protein